MSDQPKCPNGGCDVCALGGDCRIEDPTAPTPPSAEPKPLKVDLSPEWCARMADLEGDTVIAAGHPCRWCAAKVPVETDAKGVRFHRIPNDALGHLFKRCEFRPAPVSPRPEGLDFGKAQKALQDAGVPFPDFIIPQPARDALNAQVAEIVRVAVERERERVVCEERQHTQTTIDRTRAEYAPLVALVKEWQEARKAEQVAWSDPTDCDSSRWLATQRPLELATDALAAFDLGKEGDK